MVPFKVVLIWGLVCLLCVNASKQSRRREEKVQQLLNVFNNRLYEGGKYADEDAAASWMNQFNNKYAEKVNENEIAIWNYLTDVTEPHRTTMEETNIAFEKWIRKQHVQASRYYSNKDLFNDKDLRRMLKMMNSSFCTTEDDEKIERMSFLQSEMEAIYTNGTVRSSDGTKDWSLEPDIQHFISTSRDYDELQRVWKEWRDVTGARMRPFFSQLIQLQNEMAVESGFKDYGEYERIAGFDNDTDIEKMVSALYEQIEPMYKQVHAYVRRKLIDIYGADKISETGPIPAHLLGNMWAQTWNILSDITPYPEYPNYDTTKTLKQQGYDQVKMFELAEEFFTSLGMEPMTATFWDKSMIKKPKDKLVECHGSAHDFYDSDDFRIKMCTTITMGDLQTVHHEMGHIQYFMNYRHQPSIYRTGANEAFHEAIGDTIALSVMTPEHLIAVNLLNTTTSSTTSSQDFTEQNRVEKRKRDVNFLMKMALDKIVFLPYALIVDLWRWKVYRGEIDETNYNEKWWELRLKYQGLSPPVDRSEDDFDPGSKFHVANGVSYIRYFLSFISQFQFHKALCDAAPGRNGALHRCDIYGSKEAGQKLISMLKLGSSKPWPFAMQTLTGKQDFEATAIKDYFTPLVEWLKEANGNEQLGWD